MRGAWLSTAIVASGLGCGFELRGAPGDAPLIDTPDVLDAPPIPARATAGLHSLWTFSEGAGTVARDTSGTAPALDLSLLRGSLTWAPAAGTLTLGPTTELGSTLANSGLATPITAAGGVTLEIWAQPRFADPTPVLVAGVSRNVTERNVSIFQIGSKWAARVRTTSSDFDGGPSLMATTTADVATMTHLVVVADATQRTFYVNGIAEASSPAAAPVNWANYPVQLGSERDNSVTWEGAFALVAIYRRGLSAVEVRNNFLVGPSVP